MLHVYDFFGGRSTTAFWIILTIGSFGLFLGKISGGEFVSLVIALHAFLIVRAVSEDKYCGGNQCPAPPDHHENSFNNTEHKGD